MLLTSRAERSGRARPQMCAGCHLDNGRHVDRPFASKALVVCIMIPSMIYGPCTTGENSVSLDPGPLSLWIDHLDFCFFELFEIIHATRDARLRDPKREDVHHQQQDNTITS